MDISSFKAFDESLKQMFILEHLTTEATPEVLDEGFTEIKIEVEPSMTYRNWYNYSKWFHNLSDDEHLTIVTAYWDLGTFKKGSSQTFTRKTYYDWMRSFQFMTNPLVVFTDSEEFINITKKFRGDFRKKTRIFKVKRDVFWPFQLIKQIKAIYSQPTYPKHHPNTVIPEYSAAQHTKYVVLAKTAQRKYFKTPYYAWLDVGYFRDIAHSNDYYTLNPPKDFNPSKIAFNRVYNVQLKQKPSHIFMGNMVWIGGGLALGVPEVIERFEEMYHKAVLYFLDENLMNTDQQVLYSLYSDEGRKKLHPAVDLQLYIPKGSINPWFYLGFLCRKKITTDM